MASYLYRSQAILQFPRYIPTLITRAQLSQNNPTTPTPGQGIPMTGSTKTIAQTGGTKKGDSSVLPSSTTASDDSNPTKTSSDAPPLDNEHVDSSNKKTDKQHRNTSASSSKSSSSSSNSNKQQSFMSSPIVQFGTITVFAIAIYVGYKMMSGNSHDLKKNEHYKRATADYQAANAQGTDVKK